MSTLKKLSISATLLALSFGVAGQASATCAVTGKVMRAYGTNADYAYFYVGPRTAGVVPYNPKNRSWALHSMT